MIIFIYNRQKKQHPLPQRRAVRATPIVVRPILQSQADHQSQMTPTMESLNRQNQMDHQSQPIMELESLKSQQEVLNPRIPTPQESLKSQQEVPNLKVPVPQESPPKKAHRSQPSQNHQRQHPARTPRSLAMARKTKAQSQQSPTMASRRARHREKMTKSEEFLRKQNPVTTTVRKSKWLVHSSNRCNFIILMMPIIWSVKSFLNN